MGWLFLLDTQTVPRSSGERDPIPVHFGVVIAEPAFGDEFERLRVDFGVGVHHVCSHSDRGVFGDGPLLVLECDIWGAARETTHDTEAQTLFNYQLLAKNLCKFQVGGFVTEDLL